MGRLRSFLYFIFSWIAVIGLLFVMFLILLAFNRDPLVSGLVAFGIIFSLSAGITVSAHIHKKLEQRQPCMHGVRRGRAGGCQHCIEDDQQRQADLEAREAKRVLEEEIKKSAEALRTSELSKLRKMWLSQTEAYFEMGSQQFENAIAVLFRNLGFEVKQTPYSNDHGKDAIAWKNGKKYLIECKRYGAENTIGRRELQIFVAAMKEENAERGFYVNTGRFASTADEYAIQQNIELYDRANFPDLVNRAYPLREDVLNANVMCRECGQVRVLPVDDGATTSVCPSGHTIANDITKEMIRRSSFATHAKCNLRGAEMRLVKSKHRQFWGCSNYPICKFIAS